MIRFQLSLGVLGSALCLGGCPAQVDTDYQGEPLLTISGKVSSSTVELDAPIEPVFAWHDFNGDERPSLFQRAQVTGEFPNKFTMTAHSPPPARAITEHEGGERTAMARIFALRSDMAWDDHFTEEEDAPQPPWLVGGVRNYLVLYMDTPSTPGGAGEQLFGQPLERGFHLLRLDFPTDEMRAAYAACVDAAPGRALEHFNQEHGTQYGDFSDIPEEQQERWGDLEEEAYSRCDLKKVTMSLVPSGLDHPISLEMSSQLNLPDWH